MVYVNMWGVCEYVGCWRCMCEYCGICASMLWVYVWVYCMCELGVYVWMWVYGVYVSSLCMREGGFIFVHVCVCLSELCAYQV